MDLRQLPPEHEPVEEPVEPVAWHGTTASRFLVGRADKSVVVGLGWEALLWNLLTVAVGVAVGTLIGSEVMWRRMVRKLKKFARSEEFRELVREMALGARLALVAGRPALPALEVVDCGEGEGVGGGVREAEEAG